MKLRIVRVVSKETGLTQRYELQKRVLPFWWTTLETYSDDGSGSAAMEARVNADIRFALVCGRDLSYGNDVFV